MMLGGKVSWSLSRLSARVLPVAGDVSDEERGGEMGVPISTLRLTVFGRKIGVERSGMV